MCDLPSKYERIKAKYPPEEYPLVRVFKDGHDVSRHSDYIIYSVETENLDRCVSMYAKSSKVGSIVASQSSVKHPELETFNAHLPEDVQIVSLHSLHGPSLSPENQPLILVPHRCSVESKLLIRAVLEKSLRSKVTELSSLKHDEMTADTQAVTHLAYLSMGTAWFRSGMYPWLNQTYTGGIDNVKVMMALRIYSNKWHVYAGLAIYNPAAQRQIQQYAQSVLELFKLMITEDKEAFKGRILAAKQKLFSNATNDRILLSDDWLNQFSLGSVPKGVRKPNSHLSLLAMADSWCQLGVNPYDHIVCQTPPFRSWLGITEYLFRSEELLNESINAALFDKSIRADDLEFMRATQGWAHTILLKSMDGYKARFEETKNFFESTGIIDQGKKMSTKMLEIITRKYRDELSIV